MPSSRGRKIFFVFAMDPKAWVWVLMLKLDDGRALFPVHVLFDCNVVPAPSSNCSNKVAHTMIISKLNSLLSLG